jgi:FKBP-type peptidyl-prolyl cis-trans isomerase FkpA
MKHLCLPVVAMWSLAACFGSPTAPSTFAPFSQTDLVIGTGAEAVVGATLSVHYTGWFYDGSKPAQKGVQFDTSRGRDPFRFVLGAGQVIEGWERGVVGMRVGGIRRLVVPPSLGYGATRHGVVPPNATLVFEIELLAVEPPTSPSP